MTEANNTNEEYFDDDAPLAEPHFDEEATVLSARPVVPLKEIKAERSAKQLLFGLAIAGSLMLGALAATLIYKRSGTGQTSATNTVASGAAGVAVEAPATSAPAIEPIGGAVPETPPQTEISTAVKKAVPPASNNASNDASHSASHSTAPEVDTSRSTPSTELEETELTRDARIEARRLRRRAERQARREAAGRPRRSADDLLRIRDIFEGPSRP
jgi:hypothetical protein